MMHSAYLKLRRSDNLNPDYLEIHKYRAAAIERSILYAIDEIGVRELLLWEMRERLSIRGIKSRPL